jgi:hypothetical protein
VRPYLENTYTKRAGGTSQVVKCEALSSNPITAKKRRKEGKKEKKKNTKCL